MNKIREIEEAIESLSPGELEELRSWFDKHAIPESLDDRIAADFKAGRFDKVIDKALEDDAHGRTKPL